jgi:spore coat polysaccharide biosynthesis protein SpsF
MKRIIIIQARMGSTRFPGKVMKSLSGLPVLDHVLFRAKQIEGINEIIVATTNLKKDDLIEKETVKMGIKCFRGSEGDVLERYYRTARENRGDVIVRISSDCPLIDPKLSTKIIKFFLDNDYDMVSNCGISSFERTYPRGLDTEVFSFSVLEEAYYNASKGYQREHVTPYIYENNKNIYYYKNNTDLSFYRWTLDTGDDFKLIEKVYSHLYKGKHDFYMADIISLFNKRPEYLRINSNVRQKEVNDN